MNRLFRWGFKSKAYATLNSRPDSDMRSTLVLSSHNITTSTFPTCSKARSTLRARTSAPQVATWRGQNAVMYRMRGEVFPEDIRQTPYEESISDSKQRSTDRTRI